MVPTLWARRHRLGLGVCSFCYQRLTHLRYPVNNGANYLLPATDPTSRRRDDTDGPNFVLLAKEIRKQLDVYGTAANKKPFMSIAVPSKPIDMVAYQVPDTVAGLDGVVDFWNLM